MAICCAAKREKWNLDFFVYLSSVVVALGNLGQVAYAGANGFQVDLGCWQSLEKSTFNPGCNIHPIKLTVLDNVGVMHNESELQERLENTRGFPAINAETIQQMLQVVMSLTDISNITVATFDRQQLQNLALAKNPNVASRFTTVMRRFRGSGQTSTCVPMAVEAAELAALTPETTVHEPTHTSTSSSSASMDLQTLSSSSLDGGPAPTSSLPQGIKTNKSRVDILDIIQKVVGGRSLDVTQSLPKLGVDSMLSIEIKEQISRKFNIDVPQRLLEAEEPLSTILMKVESM